MLKNRLLFGILMTVFFIAVVIFDGWIDNSLSISVADDKRIQGTLFCILVALIAIPANLELSGLAATKNLKCFIPVTIPASIILATCWYWTRLFSIQPELFILLIFTFTLMGIFLYQYLKFQINQVLANCGISCLTVMYLGLLSSFAVAIRLQMGLWYLLMFVFVVKSADIGAYATGTLFGRHKFSPKISPGKTWEGLLGAIAAAIIVAMGFAVCCGIMSLWSAIIFGLIFAFIGQLGDLAESLMKRDAQQKDSAKIVPGFGGVLDIIDSSLVAAPFAYLFFLWL
jgi:phosphatidate cytidylyltransferase